MTYPVGKIELEKTSIQIEITEDLILNLIENKSYISTNNNITVELFLDMLQPEEIIKIIKEALENRKE